MKYYIHAMLGTAAIFLMSQASIAADKIALKGEPSRADRARHALKTARLKAVQRNFAFPADAVKGKVFGIDVSHHQEKFNWENVVGQGVDFAYVKATQGEHHLDPEFASNWAALGQLGRASQPVRRGAYHFLTAAGTPEAQAKNFIEEVGKLEAQDLPPCLDVEWDFLPRNGKYVLAKGNQIDQWDKVGPDELIRRIKIWLDLVEKGTGKKPIIYTNTTWWNKHVANNKKLSSYKQLSSHKLWIADYRDLAQPTVPKNFTWSMWQMTDQGMLARAGLTQGLDISVMAPEIVGMASPPR